MTEFDRTFWGDGGDFKLSIKQLIPVIGFLKNNWIYGVQLCTVIWMTNFIRNYILVRTRRY